MSQKSQSSNPLHKVATALREIRERHEERHRPSGFAFAFADHVDFLNGEAWDKATKGGSIFIRRDYLRVIEKHGPENIVPRYAIIFRDDQPVAAVAAQIVSVTGRHLRHEKGHASRARSSSPFQRAL